MNEFQGLCLVIGAKGMLGTDLVQLIAGSGTPTVAMDVEEVDITCEASVRRALDSCRPEVIINCAALTDVDGCETQANKAFEVNARGPANLARGALETGALLVHISTDYVFDGLGSRPYREDDPVSPLSVYGKSKAEGERLIREILPETHLIVRTQWLFGHNGKNFVKAIVEAARKRDVLSVVNDQHGCPTHTVDLAAALFDLCKLRGRGTFHVTNAGRATWYDFAVAILDLAGIDRVRVEPITTEELGRPAPRPKFAVLDNSKYTSLTGKPLQSWRQALKDYLGTAE